MGYRRYARWTCFPRIPHHDNHLSAPQIVWYRATRDKKGRIENRYQSRGTCETPTVHYPGCASRHSAVGYNAYGVTFSNKMGAFMVGGAGFGVALRNRSAGGPRAVNGRQDARPPLIGVQDDCLPFEDWGPFAFGVPFTNKMGPLWLGALALAWHLGTGARGARVQ